MTRLPYEDHVAVRPQWTCKIDGERWPCEPARIRLRAQMNATTLAMHMWDLSEQAAGDMPTMPVLEYFAQFTAWTRHGEGNDTVPGGESAAPGR